MIKLFLSACRMLAMQICFFSIRFPLLNAATLHVDANHTTPPYLGTSTEPFGSIQSAVDAAVHGDEIRIAAGDYRESVVISDKKLHLMGGWLGGDLEAYGESGVGGDFSLAAEPGDWTHLIGDPERPILFLQGEDASGTILERLHLSGGLRGVGMNDWPPLSDVIIRDNWIERNGHPETERGVLDGAGIFLEGERIQIIRNLIEGNQGGMGAGVSANIRQMVVSGNRFLNNDGYSDHGGGVSLGGSGVIRDNLFVNNRIGLGLNYGWGGGMTVFGSADLPAGEILMLEGNEYRENFAPSAGGGLFVDEGAVARMRHELVHHNRVGDNGNGGAGVYVDGAGSDDDWSPSFAVFEFCTIANNTGGNQNAGNGIMVEASQVTVDHSIIWGNERSFWLDARGSLEVSYSITEDFVAGAGNQVVDPFFADPEIGDYHLKSRQGRWHPISQTWLKDEVHSPGIDAGNRGADWKLEPEPNGGRVNIGVYGGSPEASQTDILNHAPNDMVLEPAMIDENLPAGSLVGMFVVSDEDADDLHDLRLAETEQYPDNQAFEIRDGKLYAVREFDFETRTSWNIFVQVGDRRGGFFSKEIMVSIVDEDEGNYLRRRLQMGSDGFSGVQDTFISMEDWDTPPQFQRNYGQSESIIVSRDGGENVLIRFDLSSIPPNSAVSEARLELYNTTPSRTPGPDAPVRRITAQAVLKPWLEGNQDNSLLVNPGDAGATGTYAEFYQDQPERNVEWGGRGMVEGVDYAATLLDTSDVGGSGWYQWDLLEQVKEWVAGRQANLGITLRDASGYDEHQDDSRVFHASQSEAFPDLRPRLLIVYNPLTPASDAGPDQFIAQWRGSSIQLDASASRTQDGVSTDGLQYRWRILSSAWGSSLEGEIYRGDASVVSFQPDVAGDWTFELEVTNQEGETATDQVTFRLWEIGDTRPRIHLTEEKVSSLRQRVASGDPRWAQLVQWLDNTEESQWDRIALARGNALRWVLTGDQASGRAAIEMALREIELPGIAPAEPGDLAPIYDWCHSLLTDSERAMFLDMFETWANDVPKGEDISGWTNYWPRYGYSYAMIGMAAFGDHPGAQGWMEAYRDRRYASYDLPVLDRIAEGGGWPEGMVYDWIANPGRILAAQAWETATGESLFESSRWFAERMDYLLMHALPGVAQQFSITYHPYIATGDSERGRGSVAVQERLMSLILLERFPEHDSAPAMNGYLMSGPTASMDRDHFMEEFLWSHPDWPQADPTILTHYAEPLGAVMMRSGWPDGAADTDANATYLTFQCGDHFSYHQHLDQNHFTLTKGAPLLIDSGVYSGDGLSFHDMNYYLRTIAHNTLVVYNPQESFDRLRDGARSNDGGQRDFFPAPRTPVSAEQHLRDAEAYETGDILRYESNDQYTYVVGDATRAYNSVAFNQASIGEDRPGNVAKLRQYQREFVYLRPDGSADEEWVVVYDRVGVTGSAFSGENTKLLFHFLEEPELDVEGQVVSPGEILHPQARQLTVRSGDARLDMDFLFPEQRNIRKVGGRGVKDFWVFDQNYNWHWDEADAVEGPVTDFDPVPFGEWRVELEPADHELDHTFLTVLRPAANGEADRHVVLGAGDQWGESALIRGTREDVLVSFARRDEGWRSIVPIRVELPVELGTKPLRFHVFNVQANVRYSFETNISQGGTRISMVENQDGRFSSSSQGVLSGVLFQPQNGRESFVDWVKRWLPEASVSDPAIAMRDSDGDGMANLLEFVWKLDPIQAGEVLPDVARLSFDPKRSSALEWVLTASVPDTARPEVDLELEWSNDLVSWHAEGVPNVVMDNGVDGTPETLFARRAIYRWPILRSDLETGNRYYRLSYRLLTP